MLLKMCTRRVAHVSSDFLQNYIENEHADPTELTKVVLVYGIACLFTENIKFNGIKKAKIIIRTLLYVSNFCC